MEAGILQNFIEQTESSLPKIRGSILVCAREGNDYGVLNAALREIALIKNAASTGGLEEIEKNAAELESQIRRLAEIKENLTDSQSHRILDELAKLETLIAKINFSFDDFSLDIGEFVDEYFDHIQIRPTLPVFEEEKVAEAEEIVAEENDDFEIDEEMLEVFALEAEELIQNIHVNLKILETSRNDREALLEIRRSAHTLKGSAGIVGLKKLSEVAHRVEDLLDYLAENEINADDAVFQLLLNATDCFELLANNEDSAQTAEKIRRIYQNCENILASLKKKTDDSEPVLKSESEQQHEVLSPPDNQITETQIQNLPAQSRSVVRVSLEKLDDLVRCVSDLVVSRSIFEQRLNELERQTTELKHTTQRLQTSANKLEIDFEADTLEVQNPAFKNHSSLAEIGNSLSAINNPQTFDSLEFDRYTEFHQITRELIETAADNSAVHADLSILKSNFEGLFDSQRRLIDEMQDKLLHLRMVTFDLLSVRLRRTVRITCDEEDKRAELFIEGENLEIDTQILDSLVEPLLHLLRNAVAHGIELPEMRRLVGKPEIGKILLRLRNDGTHLVLTVSDDGRGISAAALKEKAVKNNVISRQTADKMSENEAFSLVFLPGLTTAEKLSQISGRGVGMNIVKAGIARRQGTIAIHSEVQKGTTFTIRLPLPLAITRALPIKAGGQTFAFPLKLIKEATEIPTANIQNFVRFGETDYQVLRLNALLNLPISSSAKDSTVSVLLIEVAAKSYALIVEEILKPEEIVIKRLGFPLQNSTQFLGAATLGSGNVIPVLDLPGLLNNSIATENLKSAIQLPTNSVAENFSLGNTNPKTLIVLIVDDSPSVRHLTSKIIKNANMTAIVAKDGLEALEILQNSTDLPDVILTDVEMPRMDGYELLTSLKKQELLHKIPVIMITSRAGDKHRQKAFALGVSEYLSKPFADAVLIEKVKRLTKIQ